MQLPPLIVINVEEAPDREVLKAIHRLLEIQHHAFHYLYKELNRMNDALDALNKKADDLATAVNVETTKVDVLLQGQSDLKQQVADLTAKLAAGSPVTDGDLAAVTAKLDATLASVNAEAAKIDPATPPVVVPDPAPTTTTADGTIVGAPATPPTP